MDLQYIKEVIEKSYHDGILDERLLNQNCSLLKKIKILVNYNGSGVVSFKGFPYYFMSDRGHVVVGM